MNERIEELKLQAIDFADATYKYELSEGFKIQEWDKIRLEKFTELIVSECIDIALKKKAEQLELVSDTKAFDSMPEGAKDHSFGRVVSINQVVEDIKEHFGVE